MPLGTEVGLGPIDFVFDWNPAPPRKKGTAPTQFVANVYCYQMAGWMKTPLCMEVDVSQGHIVLDGDQAPPVKGAQSPPLFDPCLLWPWSPISATAELLFTDLLWFCYLRIRSVPFSVFFMVTTEHSSNLVTKKQTSSRATNYTGTEVMVWRLTHTINLFLSYTAKCCN